MNMYRIAAASVCLVIVGALLGSPAKPDSAQLRQQIAAYVIDQAKRDAFSGVVMLAKGNSVLFAGAYGQASKEYQTPNTVDTRFNLGSINKFMTRIAIMQLVEQHQLRYDQTLGDLLPDYPNKAAAAITVQQLLDMKSGIGDFFGPEYRATPKNQIRSLQDYVPLFAKKPLAFAPGTQQKYSNGGYVVLGLIIERVSHISYYDYVRQHIFGPAGMTASGWYEADLPTPNLASGYTRALDDDPAAPMRNNMYTRPARGSSAGGGYSTAADLLKFAAALQTGKFLDAPNTDLVKGALGIAGGAPGTSAELDIDQRDGYVLVVLSNYDPPVAEDMAKTIRDIMKTSS